MTSLWINPSAETIHGINTLKFIWGRLIDLGIKKCYLTHRGRVTHVCVNYLNITGWYNGLWPCRRQAITWTNAGTLLIWTIGTHSNKILSAIHIFSFAKINLKTSSAKWGTLRIGLNVPNSDCDWIDMVVDSWIFQSVFFMFVLSFKNDMFLSYNLFDAYGF